MTPHARLSQLASPMGPRPRPNGEDVAKATAFIDECFPHYSPIARANGISQAADLNMIARQQRLARERRECERKVMVG